MIRRRSMLAVVAALASVMALAQETPPGGKPTIAVSGEAVVEVTPDRITIVLGVETFHKDLFAARRENQAAVVSTLAMLKRRGVAPEDVHTDHIGIDPVLRYLDTTLVLRGYTVRNSLSLILRKVDMVDDVLTDALASGVNTIQGISYETSELRKHRDHARELALVAAREKGEAMARVLGCAIGTPLMIRESPNGFQYSSPSWWRGSGSMGTSQNVVSSAVGPEQDGGGGIALGKIRVRAAVDVTFELLHK